MGDELKTLLVRVTPKMYKSIQRAVEREGYTAMAELVREAVRKYLIDHGFLNEDE